jgi:uncharacterized protein (TIGR02145 family)
MRKLFQHSLSFGAAILIAAVALTLSACSGDSGNSGGGGGGDTSSSSGGTTSSCPSYDESQYFCDERDGTIYRYVVIGTQTWMAQNLNYDPGSGNRWCYDNDEVNCATYGRLYDWSTAMGFGTNCNNTGCTDQIFTPHQGICPAGWHLPDAGYAGLSGGEWAVLANAVGGSGIAGEKLKATSGWASNGNGTDDWGFSALPGGERSSAGFADQGVYGNWWSTSVYGGNYGVLRRINSGSKSFASTEWAKTMGLSVRCLKDQ